MFDGVQINKIQYDQERQCFWFCLIFYFINPMNSSERVVHAGMKMMYSSFMSTKILKNKQYKFKKISFKKWKIMRT